MSYVLTAIVFILVLSLLILVHEFGHFIAAKRSGIKVEEFGLGLPPRIWGKKKGETLYSINAIPFGGFVRMMGEDDLSGKASKSKRSFAGKPIRTRVKVLVAGVVMNFLLAWVLMTTGFTIGMQPLVAPDDFLNEVDNGLIELSEGVLVAEVLPGSLAEDAGIMPGDMIYGVGDDLISDGNLMEAINEDPYTVLDLRRGDELISYEILYDGDLEFKEEENKLGVELFGYATIPVVEANGYTYIPRVKIFEVKQGSDPYQAGLRSGDIIISVNGQNIYSTGEFEEIVRGNDELTYVIYRGGMRESFLVELNTKGTIILSDVVKDSPADEAGLKEGDTIVSVNGFEFKNMLEMIAFLENSKDENMAYLIERDGERIFYEMKTKEGKIGVILSELRDYGEGQEMSVYNTDVLSTVINVNQEKYPIYEAVYEGFNETVDLSYFTLKMFKQFVTGLIGRGEISETVSGPVEIARLTHGFVQKGAIPVLQFIAILSLSLAVINILPFPALDGGRLLFVLIELLLGRKVSPKWEAHIHVVGYVLILFLILAVTYSDIVQLFK